MKLPNDDHSYLQSKQLESWYLSMPWGQKVSVCYTLLHSEPVSALSLPTVWFPWWRGTQKWLDVERLCLRDTSRRWKCHQWASTMDWCKISTDGILISSNHLSIWNLVKQTWCKFRGLWLNSTNVVILLNDIFWIKFDIY